MSLTQWFIPLLSLLFIACGTKSDTAEDAGNSFLGICGEFCVYGYENAEGCDEEALNTYLSSCQSDCAALDNTLDDDCKVTTTDAMECHMQGVQYSCTAGTVEAEETGCPSEDAAARDCRS